LGEQVTEAAETVKDYAVDAAVAGREKVGAYAQSALETAEDFATERAANTLEGARKAAARAVNAGQRATSHAIADGSLRDQVLLGAAGAAVVAALGIAYQRRKTGELRAWE
jgi:hypothetical protein